MRIGPLPCKLGQGVSPVAVGRFGYSRFGSHVDQPKGALVVEVAY